MLESLRYRMHVTMRVGPQVISVFLKLLIKVVRVILLGPLWPLGRSRLIPCSSGCYGVSFVIRLLRCIDFVNIRISDIYAPVRGAVVVEDVVTHVL